MFLQSDKHQTFRIQPEDYFFTLRSGSSQSTKASNVVAIPIPERAIISRLRPRNEDHIPEAVPVSKRRVGLTDKTLDNTRGFYKCRLSHEKHWPVVSHAANHPRCQLHTWATDSKIRKKKQVMLCGICNVYLCLPCWKTFHETQDLVREKPKIRTTMMIDQKTDNG